jgi:predicted 3-demethylubiquinone-9 3-methyltransferase (glyoxalase superfamily)
MHDTKGDAVQKFSPFLWFDDQAEEAAMFYTSVFERSRIVDILHYPDEGVGDERRVMSVTFELDGQTFVALNGGPEPRSPFSPAMSFFIHCPTQREVDALWERLGEGGERLQCGWLRDKFGVTWQVMPTALGEMLSDENRARAARVMRAMTRMCKLDMAQLQRVYEGEGA